MAAYSEDQTSFIGPLISSEFWSKLETLKKNLESIEATNLIVLERNANKNILKTNKAVTR